MVVLEEGSMLTTGHNQYLQPDYLSPLPMTLDSKKSPLALLAQTCSQIGADSPTKPLLSPLDKGSKGSSAATNARSPPAAKLERTRSSPSDSNKSSNGPNVAFKPYDTAIASKRLSTDSDSVGSTRPASKASSVHSASGNESANNSASTESESNNNNNNHSKKSRSTPVGRKSLSPAAPTASPSTERKTPASDRDKSSASPRNNNSGTSPIIRSGMDVLSGKDSATGLYKSTIPGFPGANPLCCPPGLAENPAFRPPFGGASPFSHHHAAALLGYPPSASPTSNPYLNYARVKTPSGGESLVPVCKDPYCTGCQYSMHNAQMMMAAAAAAAGGACPSGCTQCDHQKYGLMALSGLGGPMAPPGLYGAPGAAAAGGRPHVCSWIAGDSYCGKRFSSSEELLQHLRSHTSLANGTNDPAAAAALLASQHAHPLLSPTAALQRAAAAAAAGASYPAPSLSPLSASRYHPYGKPPTGPLPASLAASPYSAFNTLGPYYSPYAIYGQRIGAAVHP